jgi:rhodanese-related sulfurtransferase
VFEWLFGSRERLDVITGPDLAREIKSGDKPYVLDVRQPGEFRTGHIPGAHLIPLGEVAKRIEEIPKDKVIVTVCRSGHRSAMAAQQLVKAGYTVKNLAGGMMAWQGPTKR